MRAITSSISAKSVTDQEGGGNMNMREIHEHVHGMINADVVDVDIKLVPTLFSAYPEEQVQMQMAVAVMGMDNDMRYFSFSMKSGYVVWDDDERVKVTLDYMISYMARKIGMMITQGKEAA